MESLTSYYLNECAINTIENIVSAIYESKIKGDEIDAKDEDNDGVPDEFYVYLSKMIDEELEFELGESMKARVPKLKGKAEKARKAKANIMRNLMSNPEVQGLVTRLKAVLKRTARATANQIGVSGRQINKALSGKVKI